jgi:hypothetical protein
LRIFPSFTGPLFITFFTVFLPEPHFVAQFAGPRRAVLGEKLSERTRLEDDDETDPAAV